ncbi:MAG TPA: PDZ domain-containing protein [Pyrinomonadaceae bacterium]|nr:PDZ domain-containing protein [Pyrinomonadaceae bacterium]
MRRDLTTIAFAVVLVSTLFVPASGQTPAPEPAQVHVHSQQTTDKIKAAKVKAAEQAKADARASMQDKRRQQAQTRNSTSVIVENEVIAPQIVTILHRLNGLKVMRLLRRSTEEPGSVAAFDDAFRMSKEMHTNIIAGLTLDDGETIAAWLPEAEAEMAPPAIHYAPHPPNPPNVPLLPGQPDEPSPQPRTTPVTPRPQPGQFKFGLAMPSISAPLLGLFEPDLKIVTRDGKRLLGHYLGLDGLTGLSVITLKGANLPQMVEAREPVKVGQRLRVIGPQPAPRPGTAARTGMYVRVAQTDAIVSALSKSPSGGLVRFKIKAPKLTTANIGAIAVNEAGETMGILDTVDGHEATIVPIASVRSAVKRVLERQASVPKPWLGVRGEPIGVLTMDKIVGVGWTAERAKELCENQNGILLTSVVPGSPAALNQLKAGDVILEVNNSQIKNGDEFTWILQEAGPGSSVQFTVARPGKAATEALQIQLSESPDPLYGRRVSSSFSGPRNAEPGSLMSQGIEAMAIKPKAGTRLGSGGLLVVYVHPSTAAHKAGLRNGDIIEAIDGQNLTSGRYKRPLLKNPGTSSAFSIVRNKQKMQLTITTVK